MTEKTLQERLETIGKTVFVENFSLFQKCYANENDFSEKCRMELSEKKGGGEGTYGGATWCCGEAKVIFHQGREQEALEIIAFDSKKLSSAVKRRAQELIISLRNKAKQAAKNNLPQKRASRSVSRILS